jgi:hypothetical protein
MSEETREECGPKKERLRFKVPRQVGAAIDLLHGVRAARKALQARAESEKRQEEMIEERIFKMFDKAELDGGAGRVAQASVSRSDVPTIEDWEKLENHVIRTGELDLFQRRLSVEACRERWGQRKAIPGVGTFTRVRLHLTKRK